MCQKWYINLSAHKFYIKQNQSIEAHTLILTDIGLTISPAIKQLLESSTKENLSLPEKIIAISNAETPQQKIFYDTPENLIPSDNRTPNTESKCPSV